MDKARLYQDGKIGEPVLAREIDDELGGVGRRSR